MDRTLVSVLFLTEWRLTVLRGMSATCTRCCVPIPARCVERITVAVEHRRSVRRHPGPARLAQSSQTERRATTRHGPYPWPHPHTTSFAATCPNTRTSTKGPSASSFSRHFAPSNGPRTMHGTDDAYSPRGACVLRDAALVCRASVVVVVIATVARRVARRFGG